LLYARWEREKESLASLQAAIARSGSRRTFTMRNSRLRARMRASDARPIAVEWLRRTAENGMPNYPLFRNDPNLRGLQGDPGYERLMATLERQFVAYGSWCTRNARADRHLPSV
jgi:hypothetical protein